MPSKNLICQNLFAQYRLLSFRSKTKLMELDIQKDIISNQGVYARRKTLLEPTLFLCSVL
jgi:hypothetical protein